MISFDMPILGPNVPRGTLGLFSDTELVENPVQDIGWRGLTDKIAKGSVGLQQIDGQ
jgi:hypothetical protein